MYTTSGLAKGLRLRGAEFRFENISSRKFCQKPALCSHILFASLKAVHRPRSDSPQHFDSKKIYQFVQKNKMLALGNCLSQLCSSAGRRIAASKSRLQYYRRIVSFPQQKIRWNAFQSGFHWESTLVQEIPNPTLNSKSGFLSSRWYIWIHCALLLERNYFLKLDVTVERVSLDKGLAQRIFEYGAMCSAILSTSYI